MLRNTFCHLPRIAHGKERALWKAGITDWKSFLDADLVNGIAAHKKPWFDRQLLAAQKAVFDGNSGFFSNIPSTETWRLWDEFGDEAAFIDIETNWHNDITVLGISDGNETWQFLRHTNMNAKDIKEVLSRFKLLVTFNGASFDLPIIRRYFSDVLPNVPHIDLRHAAAKVGLRGGLKAIEQEVGIARPEDLDGVSGADALKLWHAYRNTGNERFRDILLEYNAEDILNLKPLAEIVYARLQEDLSKHIKARTP